MILTSAHGYMGSVLRERPKDCGNPHVGFNAKVGRLPPSRGVEQVRAAARTWSQSPKSSEWRLLLNISLFVVFFIFES